jgi:lipopolysaccharide transport system permease protein
LAQRPSSTKGGSLAAMNAEKTIIRAGQIEKQYWRDFWKYRELFYFLAWRDLLVRYKQTVVGVAWSLLRPLFSMVVLTIVFGKVAKVSFGGVPDPLMVFIGLLPWSFFANALGESSNSLVGNANLISKIYFPRLIIPLSSVVIGLVDLVISGIMLALLMAYYRFAPSWQVVFLPGFVVLAAAAAMGGGIWLSALTVKYRDFRVVVPFIVQFGFFLSPLGYPLEKVPEKWRLLYSMNPMVGVIDGFRWAIVGGESRLYLPGLVLSILLVALLLWGGLWYFRKTERLFADVI